jgi:hypothetical protein
MQRLGVRSLVLTLYSVLSGGFIFSVKAQPIKSIITHWLPKPKPHSTTRIGRAMQTVCSEPYTARDIFT